MFTLKKSILALLLLILAPLASATTTSSTTSSTSSSNTESSIANFIASFPSATPPANPFNGACASGGIDCLIGGFGAQQWSLLVGPVYDEDTLMAAGATLPQLPSLAFQQSLPLTQQALQINLTNTLSNTPITTPTPALSSQIASAMINQYPAALPTLPLMQLVGLNPLSLSLQPGSMQQKIMSFFSGNNIPLDPNNLLGFYQYQNSSQQNAALGYIAYASGIANPLQVLDFRSLQHPATGQTSAQPYSANEIYNLAQQPDVARYLASLRSYAAQVAASYSTMYYYFAERQPISNSSVQQSLLTAAGTPPTKSQLQTLPQPASALQIKQFLATRRLSDPQWYIQMQNASPAEISKQTLFLLNEMRAEMFNMEMEMERTNTLLAVLIAQNGNQQKANLNRQRANIQSTPPFSTVTSKPSTDSPADA